MYSIGKSYKFQLDDGIFYTGKIIEEDDLNLKVETIMNETLILAKSHIKRSTELRGTEDVRRTKE